MADNLMMPNEAGNVAKVKEEKKKFKEQQKAQKKEAKKKAKELAAREAELTEDDENTGPVILTTLVIILVWVGIICALIKLDIGGFGSGVVAPILKNVPVVNKILPDESTGNVAQSTESKVDVAGYSSLEEAVLEIEDLEKELIDYQEELNAKKGLIRSLLAKKMDIYKVPELVFIKDDTYDNGEKIEAIIRDLNIKNED